LKLIDNKFKLHSSIAHMKLDMPQIAIMSNPRYIDNFVYLLKILKEMDHKFWMRGELFGSITLVIISF